MALSIPPPSVGAAPKGFVELDERILSLAPGVVVVRATRAGEGATVNAIVAHAARRIRGGGAFVASGRASKGAPLWREIASRLGVAELACDPTRAAEQILEAAATQRGAIVVALPPQGTWDRAVAAEVARLAQTGLVVLVADQADTAQDIPGDPYDVVPTLDADARRRWWTAVAEEGGALAGNLDLASLEAWWSAKRRASNVQPTTVPESGRTLFTALALLGRAWPESDIGVLGAEPNALRDLGAVGAVSVERGWISIDPSFDGLAEQAAADATADERAHTAKALVDRTCEPWALARAAELFADAGDVQAAEDTHVRATTNVDDATARSEIIAGWMSATESLSPDQRLQVYSRAAERAIASGNADEAYKFAQNTIALAKEKTQEAAAATLLLGRAAAALGDLVTARVALERGRADAEDDEATARIAVELAEIHYLAGELAAASREATAALGAVAPSTRLRARNTLGKLLLAEAKWDAADRHFTEDAQTAIACGDRTAELRARLNRGIALLSMGLMDQARAIFEGILADGERLGDARACAFALDNLAVADTLRHDYAGALAAYERTLKIRQRLGDRLSMTRILANVAELRFNLGLVDQAAHAVAFGRRTLGPAMRMKGNTLSAVAALIALERGNTVLARREVSRALVDSEAMGDQFVVGTVYAIATRVALEDGDVVRAGETLAKAKKLAHNDEGRAEVALLEALWARARGAPLSETLELAGEALANARRSGRERIERQAHVLLCEIYRASGESEAARAHIEHAASLRDRIAETLPETMHAAFLSVSDVAVIARLQELLAAPLEDDAPRTQRSEPPPSSDRPLSSAPRDASRERRDEREIVGNDPAIRGLLAAIKKVARSNATVLVRGESGTGKELVAEALHRASDRASGPLVTVNCAALVETLLLSELFGHEKGAFTGAFARRRGRFELAEGGTLFLDEIGDISQRTQVALLRVLQERTFERVGGTTAIRANVRIICATHRDLKAMVERGEFREDLYYRLREITLEVPALRNRMGDLPQIAEALLRRIATERSESPKVLTPEAIELLGRHKWPGNVRELENALRAASLFAEGSTIAAPDITDNVDDLRGLAVSTASVTSSRASMVSLLPTPSSSNDTAAAAAIGGSDEEGESGALPAGEATATAVAYAQVRQGGVSLGGMKRQIERDCIARALAETKGNITRAAALLGMKRPRLSQLVKQYGLAAISSEDW